MEFKEKLLLGTLIKRYKRFFVDIKYKNKTITAHCPNSGSMMGLLNSDNKVWFSQSDNPKRKLHYTLQMISVNKKLVGFLAMSSLILRGKIFQKPLEKYLIKNKKGAYLWWICGDNKYKHVSNPLFNVFNKYLSKNQYNYVLLVMEKEKIGLMKLYMNQKYKKIGFTTFISKNDMIVMKKIIL